MAAPYVTRLFPHQDLSVLHVVSAAIGLTVFRHGPLYLIMLPGTCRIICEPHLLLEIFRWLAVPVLDMLWWSVAKQLRTGCATQAPARSQASKSVAGHHEHSKSAAPSTWQSLIVVSKALCPEFLRSSNLQLIALHVTCVKTHSAAHASLSTASCCECVH